MKPTKKRLSLNTETVRELTDSESSQAAGGGISQMTCNMVCGFTGPTVCVSYHPCVRTLVC